jgi:glycosyltransferase involved in cell wall biosynthesis
VKVACIAIALNEACEVAGWANATSEADYRLVVDTGSDDRTQHLLVASGIATHSISIKPFRFDDAMNVALASVPADIDVVFRVDMDERPRPGWHAAIDRLWTPDTTTMIYHKIFYTPTLCTHGANIFARQGYRYAGAVHECPVWRGYGAPCGIFTDDIIVDHFPRLDKPRPDHLELLYETTRDAPHDMRSSLLLSNELVTRQMNAEAIIELNRYLTFDGRVGQDAAHVFRQLAKVDPHHALNYLIQADQAHKGPSNDLAFGDFYSPFEPRIALRYYEAAFHHPQAIAYRTNPLHVGHWNDDPRLHGNHLADIIGQMHERVL